MTSELIKAKVSTYDAPNVLDRILLSKLYAGFGNELVAQNRTCPLMFSSDNYVGVIGTASNWSLPWDDFTLPIYLRPVEREKTVTLIQARQVAIEALLDAEKERKEESESEARFWLNLEGE